MKTVKLERLYDVAFDLMNIHNPDGFEFSMTIVFDEGVMIDFDKNHRPVGIDLINFSKKIKILPQNLKNLEIKSSLSISRKFLTFKFEVRYMESPRVYEKVISNDWGFPPEEFEFQIVNVSLEEV